MLCSCCQTELAAVLLAPMFPLQGFFSITNSCANRNESVLFFNACSKRRIHSFGVCLATFEKRLRMLYKLYTLHFTHLWLQKCLTQMIRKKNKIYIQTFLHSALLWGKVQLENIRWCVFQRATTCYVSLFYPTKSAGTKGPLFVLS